MLYLEDLKADWSGDEAGSGDELPPVENWTPEDEVDPDEETRRAEMARENEADEVLKKQREERRRLYAEAAAIPYDSVDAVLKVSISLSSLSISLSLSLSLSLSAYVSLISPPKTQNQYPATTASKRTRKRTKQVDDSQ